MRRALPTTLLVLALAGCGSTKHDASPTGATSPSIPPANSASSLQQAVKTAVLANNHLSVYVLWHNQIPSWATQSTQGPALDELRASASTRRGRGIRIKLISARYELLNVRLDPSYETATAVVRNRGRVLPYEAGRAPGHPITFDRRAQLVLHRVGTSERFVVWKLEEI